MATSNSTDYSLTAREIVSYAYRKLGIVSDDGDITAPQLSRGMLELSIMLKEWQKYEQIWRLTEGYVNTLHDTFGYSLTPQPYRIHSVRYRSATDGNDVPMWEMTREQYYELPDKKATGVPNQWFFDHQRDTNSLWVWPSLSTDGGEVPSFRVTYQRRYEDVDFPANLVDVPQQYLSLVGYNLASRISDKLELKGASLQKVVLRAEALLQEMLDDDREAFVQLVPERRDYG